MRYGIGSLCLLLVSVLSADCGDLAPARGVPPPTPREWSLATLNLWRFRDAIRHSDLDEPLSPALLEQRVQALADFIGGTLQAPHLLALQEVENRGLLDRLVARLAAAGWKYRAILKEGNDPSGMDVGVLYRDPVQVASAQGMFASQRFQGHALFSRPPLRVRILRPWRFLLVVVHQRSARRLGKSTVYEKRQRQAAWLANWVRRQSSPLIVAGDFNSTWGAGQFAASYARFAQAGLFNVWQYLPVHERYSFRYRCRPQALDHIWVSDALKPGIRRVAASRGNAGRYHSLYGSEGVSPVSDHDALVLYGERELEE